MILLILSVGIIVSCFPFLRVYSVFTSCALELGTSVSNKFAHKCTNNEETKLAVKGTMDTECPLGIAMSMGGSDTP